MKVIECAQGSPEWRRARAGIPTASQFHRVITPKRGERSAQMEDFINDLVAERFTGYPLATPEMPWMAEGTAREPEAAAYYELTQGVELEVVGLCTTDDGKIGASPDRLVGDNGLLELKNPKVSTHIGYLLGAGPDESYKCQLLGQLYVCEREWVDICSYCPGLPEVIVRVERDEKFIEKMAALLYEVVEQVESRMENLRARGYEAKREEVSDPLGVNDEDLAEIFGYVQEAANAQ